MSQSHDELLSAYLDGELTAVEQAEVERLLASDPSARQLLEELRGVSKAIRELPKETLGEDLMQEVLRVAQGRREEPQTGSGEEWDSSRPEPLRRPVLRRFVNRRTIGWLSITVAIAVMIAINERRHPQPGPAANREVARTGPKLEKDKADKPAATIPSIRAADSDRIVAKKDAAPAATGSSARIAEGAKFGKPRAAGSASVPPHASALPAAIADLPGSAASALVVRCDVAPKAAESRALEKLLGANGLSWREETGRGGAPDNKSKQVKVATEPVIERAKFLYADATPKQIDAVLAGLAAQPEIFLTVDVRPPTRAPERAPGGGGAGKDNSDLSAAESNKPANPADGSERAITYGDAMDRASIARSAEASRAPLAQRRDRWSRTPPAADLQFRQTPLLGGRKFEEDEGGLRAPVGSPAKENASRRSPSKEYLGAPTSLSEAERSEPGEGPLSESVAMPRRPVVFVLRIVQASASGDAKAASGPAVPGMSAAKPIEQKAGEASRKGR